MRVGCVNGGRAQRIYPTARPYAITNQRQGCEPSERLAVASYAPGKSPPYMSPSPLWGEGWGEGRMMGTAGMGIPALRLGFGQLRTGVDTRPYVESFPLA